MRPRRPARRRMLELSGAWCYFRPTKPYLQELPPLRLGLFDFYDQLGFTAHTWTCEVRLLDSRLPFWHCCRLVFPDHSGLPLLHHHPTELRSVVLYSFRPPVLAPSLGPLLIACCSCRPRELSHARPAGQGKSAQINSYRHWRHACCISPATTAAPAPVVSSTTGRISFVQ